MLQGNFRNKCLECRVDDDVKSRISVYNQAINKMQQVPKLRNASNFH